MSRLFRFTVTCLAAVAILSGAESGSAAFLTKIAGVYKKQFKNGLVNGEEYQSEDVLEVVPINDHAAYVRMDLEFYNGHSGRIYGIATYGANSLVYDNHKTGNERCVVEYVWNNDTVVTKTDYEKTPGCTYYHGARGTLDGATFELKKKKEIRYMDRLKNSREFKEAMEEYRKSL